MNKDVCLFIRYCVMVVVLVLLLLRPDNHIIYAYSQLIEKGKIKYYINLLATVSMLLMLTEFNVIIFIKNMVVLS